MFSTSSSILSLSNEEIKCLVEQSNNIKGSPSKEPDRFIQQTNQVLSQIPERIQQQIQNFVKTGSSTGFLCIGILPLEEQEIPKTPDGNHYHCGEHTRMARIQAIFNQLCGEMIAYEAEGEGRLFQDMVPKRELSTTQTSLSSHVELEIHTEQAFSQLRPDYLSLACLRGDPSAKTYVFHIQQILKHLSPEKIGKLREPRWTVGVDLSFKMGGKYEFLEGGDLRGPLPIIYGSQEDPFLVFDQDLMKGIDEEAENLKQEIIQLYYQYREEYVLSPGEILIIDNRRVVHGRSPFQPRYDGSDRFIIRSFVVLDIKKSEYARSGETPRMVSAIYS
jgi:L-asparagine oxygenase